jgi:hypothetical protein
MSEAGCSYVLALASNLRPPTVNGSRETLHPSQVFSSFADHPYGDLEPVI